MDFDAMTDEQKAVCDEAMELYATWLNHFHDELKEPVHVDRSFYFEYGQPHLVADNVTGWHRVLVFELNPYWDEGGPTTMYVWTKALLPDEHEPLKINHMVQEFDTLLSLIYHDEQIVLPPMNGPIRERNS